MRQYTIFFGEDNLQVFEGVDGRYWFGGSASKLYPGTLIYFTKRKVDEALKDIKKRIESDPSYKNGIMRTMEFKVLRFDVVPRF